MASLGSPWTNAHPSGDDRPRELAWRAGGTSTNDGIGHLRILLTRGITLGKETSESGQKRSKETKMAIRKGRTPTTPRKPRRFRSRPKSKKQRRREEREEHQRLGEYLLLLEQRELAMWILATGCGVCEHHQAGSQMLFVRVAGSPCEQMHQQEVSAQGSGLRGGDERDDEGSARDPSEGDSKKEGGHEEKVKQDMDKKIYDYVHARKFRFLHHFSGLRDPLGGEIHRIAKKRNLKVEVISTEKDWGEDLCADEPYNTHLQWAREGLIDGYHSGFPCSTYSRLRFRRVEGLPEPVRTRSEPYGCKSNDERQQQECDRGTAMLARSTNIAEEIAKTPTTAIVVKPVTMENPPPSEHEEHVSAWGMAEMVRFLRLPGVKVSFFNTCAYQADRARGIGSPNSLQAPSSASSR